MEINKKNTAVQSRFYEIITRVLLFPIPPFSAVSSMKITRAKYSKMLLLILYNPMCNFDRVITSRLLISISDTPISLREILFVVAALILYANSQIIIEFAII